MFTDEYGSYGCQISRKSKWHITSYNMQVIAFSDEEGVRFQSTFLGSAAMAGVLPVRSLHMTDKRYNC